MRDAGVNTTLPLVSVVVPVFRDAALIETCVRALEGQTYPAERFEVIAVDNGENGDLQALLRPYRRVVVISEPEPTQPAAANRGIAQARGEVIAFTDADCIPRPDWLERGVAALLADPNCGQVGGAIEFTFRDPAGPNTVEIYDSSVYMQQARLVHTAHFAATANMFTWRHVIEAVGGFDARLRSGNDSDFGRRVFAAGYVQRYAADARVIHPARANWVALYGKVARTMGGEIALRRRDGYRVPDLIRDVIADVTGPLRVLVSVWSDHRFGHWWQRLQFVAATTFARAVRLWERTRLLCGGHPRRSTR